jgi:hypothetical protein
MWDEDSFSDVSIDSDDTYIIIKLEDLITDQ